MPEKSEDPPKVTKVGPRRAQSTPAQDQGEEPREESKEKTGANDDRLRADRPPHY